MKNSLVLGLTFLCLAAPLLADEPPTFSAPAAVNQAQFTQQRERLLRYGSRLQAVNDKYHVFQRICDIASEDQIAVLHKLRISPKQGMELVRLIQKNMPEGALDKDGQAALRRKIQPEAEKILGSEQFDQLLELSPSPQQLEKIDAILLEASGTPEGVLARQAATELSASLTAEQRRFLDPMLSLAKQSNAPPPKAAPAPKRKKPAAPAVKPDRHLVILRTTSLGDSFADQLPEYDYGVALPTTYRVTGADPDFLAAVSSSSGLPVRVLGNVNGDTLQVAGNSFTGPPALVSVPGDLRIWHGSLPAHVTATSPPTVQMNAGRGQQVTAVLDFQNAGEKQKYDKFAAKGGEFLLTGTCLQKGEQFTMVDMDFSPWQPPTAPFDASVLLQVSEEFLRHAAGEYLAGHMNELSGGSATGASFRVSDLGASLHDCQGSQVRLYGRFAGGHSGLDVLEGQFEVLAQPTFSGNKVQMAPVPGSLRLRLTFPLLAATPASWGTTLEQIMGPEYAAGMSMALPDKYRTQVLDCGIMEAGQLDGLKVFALSSRDRRTSLLAVAAPSATPVGAPDALRNRIVSPGEVTVAVNGEAINAAMKKKLPPMMPIIRPIPASMQNQDGVKLSQLQIDQLDISFQQGVFQINNCATSVHWSYALFGGIEPAFRFKGTATLGGSGNPFKPTATLQVENLDFLSPRLLSGPPAEQQAQKEKLIKAMQETPLELPLATLMEATMLSKRANFAVSGITNSPSPSELLLHGRLTP